MTDANRDQVKAKDEHAKKSVVLRSEVIIRESCGCRRSSESNVGNTKQGASLAYAVKEEEDVQKLAVHGGPKAPKDLTNLPEWPIVTKDDRIHPAVEGFPKAPHQGADGSKELSEAMS